MKSVKYNLHVSRINEIPNNTIEVLANDGKITANRLFLRLASGVVHAKLLENPDLNILDLKDHKKRTINCLLNGIYTGLTTFKDEVEEEEVTRLAQELDIGIIQTALTGEGKNIKIEAPAVPEEESINEDPGLIPLKDGNYGCGLCFKSFTRFQVAKRHYQNIHFAQEKNISCRAPGCDKKFAILRYMKEHMRASHGISAKLIQTIRSTKSSSKSTQPLKKGIKKEPSMKVMKKEEPQKLDIKQELIEPSTKVIKKEEDLEMDVKQEPIED